jgi:hypothetical protein
MRKLILLTIGAVFLAFAGLAAADSTPTTTSTTTTTTTTPTTTTNATPATTTTTQTPAPNTLKVHLHWFAGSVSSVGTSTITVGVLWTGAHDGYLNGQTVTLNVDPSARISQGRDHTPIALAQIQPNDLVAIRATGSSTSDLTAFKIHDQCNCHWVGGTIGTVGATSFTVNVTKTGPLDTVLDNTTVTMQVNSDTVYLRGRHHARIGLGDLQSGQGVGVMFGANGFFKAPGFDPPTAIFTAKRVHVWGKGIVPPPASDANVSANVST